MSKKTPNTITVAKITVVGTIIVAIISLIGNLMLGYWQFILKPGEAEKPEHALPSESLAAEQIPLDLFAYGGNDNPDGGYATFVLVNDREAVPNYRLDYSLPADKYGYAGLAFKFHESMDLSTYDAIECAITFSRPAGEIDLYLKDMDDHFNTVRVISSGVGEVALHYDFQNFPDIDFNAVREIGLVASTDFSTGLHQVIIRNIRFAR